MGLDGKWVSNATITDANVINTRAGRTLAQIFEQARNGNVVRSRAFRSPIPDGPSRGSAPSQPKPTDALNAGPLAIIALSARPRTCQSPLGLGNPACSRCAPAGPGCRSDGPQPAPSTYFLDLGRVPPPRVLIRWRRWMRRVAHPLTIDVPILSLGGPARNTIDADH